MSQFSFLLLVVILSSMAGIMSAGVFEHYWLVGAAAVLYLVGFFAGYADGRRRRFPLPPTGGRPWGG